MAARADYREELTARIIEQLEAGTAPWQQSWTGRETRPYNATTEKPYRGANSLYLSVVAFNRGYTDPRWATYKQAQDQGWQVRKGEKGVGIAYWKRSDTDRPGDDPPADRATKGRMSVFYATVFHVSQMDGVPTLEPLKVEWDPIERAETIMKNAGAKILHDQANSAFYRPSTDTIHLPLREQFKDQAAYYSVALHELGHWTGHDTRLNRDLKPRTDKESYSREELRAELASYFLSDQLAIPHDPGDHASYVQSWIKVLREDKNELFRAARDAEKITEYILAFDRTLERQQRTGIESITRRDFDDPVRAAVQSAVIAAVEENPDVFLKKYEALPQSLGGRYISADLMKETFDQYSASNAARNAFNAPVHNAASVLASEQLRRVLELEKEPGREVVLFVSGIPGAGKTSMVLNAGVLPDAAHAVYEGQMAAPGVAIQKVDQVLEAGYSPAVIVVHTKPEVALDNTLARFSEIGRGAGIDLMAKLQGELPNGLAALHQQFGDQVTLQIIDRRDFNAPKPIEGWNNLAILRSEGNYEEIKSRLQRHLETRRHAIDVDGYAQAIGAAPRSPAQESGRADVGERPGARDGSTRPGAREETPVLTDGARRARAFQTLTEDRAVAEHPELRPVYDGLRAIEKDIAIQFPTNAEARAMYLNAARTSIADRLRAGEKLHLREPTRDVAAPERRVPEPAR